MRFKIIFCENFKPLTTHHSVLAQLSTFSISDQKFNALNIVAKSDRLSEWIPVFVGFNTRRSR